MIGDAESLEINLATRHGIFEREAAVAPLLQKKRRPRSKTPDLPVVGKTPHHPPNKRARPWLKNRDEAIALAIQHANGSIGLVEEPKRHNPRRGVGDRRGPKGIGPETA
jgi:hypothetical protein